MRAILHVGMPKTGTTALQQFLTMNEERLSEQGVLYSRHLRLNDQRPNHHAFALAFLEKPPAHFHPRFGSRYSADEYTQLLREEIASSRPHTVILSSEHIYTMDYALPVLRRIYASLAFLENICVYIVFRRPSSMAPSMYAQYVVSAKVPPLSPDRYLAKEEAAGSFDYLRRLQDFAEVFGEHRIFVRLYEEVRNDGIRPLADLADFRVDGAWSGVGERNRRASWPTIRLMRWAMTLPMAGRRARSILKKLDGWLPDGGWRRRLEAPFAPYAATTLSALDERYYRPLVEWQAASRQKV